MGQVARVVGHVDRVADLITGRSAELNQKRRPGEVCTGHCGIGLQSHQRRHGQHREHADHHVGQPALHRVQQVVADHRNHHGEHDHQGIPRRPAARQHGVDGIGGENHVEHIEADVHEDHRDERHNRSAQAELGARLDHLRQAHARALVGVEGHGECAQAHADDDRQDRVHQAQAQGRAGKTGDHGGQDKVTGEPERTLVPDFAVAFMARHVVDGTGFDFQAGGGGRWRLVRGSIHRFTVCFYGD